MTKQLALDLGDQDLGARGRRAPAGGRATATAPSPLERGGRGSRPSKATAKVPSRATAKPQSKATAKPQATAKARQSATTGPVAPGTASRFPIVDEQWRLDQHTREIGLKGVAEVRRVLAAIAVPDAA